MTSTRDRGYTLIELLIAALVASLVLGVLLQLAARAERSTRVRADEADLQQRVRIAAERIRSDLLLAGAGPPGASWPRPLAAIVPSIVPARTGARGADPALTAHADRISLLRVPEDGSHAVLAAPMPDAAAPLAIAPCRRAADCGFAAGDRALVVDPADPALPFDVFTVAGTTGSLVVPDSPLAHPYAAGSRLTAVVERVYYHDRPGARLMLYDGGGSDLPLVDHVVDLGFHYLLDPSPASVPPPESGAANCVYAGPPLVSRLADLGGLLLVPAAAGVLTDGPVCGAGARRYDADLLRIRRVRVTLRLEAESTVLRGSGPRFSRPGTSPGGSDAVPDQLVVFDVSPRNLNLWR